MRAILVGAGGMGQGWASNLANQPDGVEIASWVDVRPDAARSAAERLGLTVGRFDATLEDALREGDADFVVDVTPPEIHRDVTVTALGAGLPVIGEKPMAHSIAAAKEMVAASDSAGKLYMVSQSRRYIAKQDAYRDLISRLGRLGILNVDFYIGAHFGGFRDEMASVLLVDMAIHTLDQARYLTGLDPVSVYAEEWVAPWSWYRGEASANALFEMTDGVRFCYRGSWCAEGAMTSWDGNWRAVGERGTAVWNGHDLPYADLVTGPNGFHSLTERVEGVAPVGKKGGIEGSLDEFLRALRTGETPNGECHDNLKSLAMVFAAVESSKRGERVEIAEILA